MFQELSPFRTLTVAFALSVAAGCATSEAPAPAAASSAPATAASGAFADQVTAGRALYVQHCAKCHGDSGQGNPGPRVVGLKEGALPLEPPAARKFRKTRFVTVADVAEFTVKNMPPGKGGSLTGDQYWSILAFDLHANGIDLAAPLTPALAQTLTIPH